MAAGLNDLKVISRSRLGLLSESARGRSRLRDNLNLHSDLADPIQRLVIALEPGTYIRPHRHSAAPKWELMTWLAGSAVMLTFNDDGAVHQRTGLDPGSPVVEVPAETWHTLFAQEKGTVILEVKPGPYVPLSGDDFAAWTPAENSPEVSSILSWFSRASPGDRYPPL